MTAPLATMRIERIADRSEFRPPYWSVEVDFATAEVAFAVVDHVGARHLEVRVAYTYSEHWQPIRAFATAFASRIASTASQPSRALFTHPPYRIVAGRHDVTLHADGLLRFLADPQLRDPLRFLVKRLALIKRLRR